MYLRMRSAASTVSETPFPSTDAVPDFAGSEFSIKHSTARSLRGGALILACVVFTSLIFYLVYHSEHSIYVFGRYPRFYLFEQRRHQPAQPVGNVDRAWTRVARYNEWWTSHHIFGPSLREIEYFHNRRERRRRMELKKKRGMVYYGSMDTVKKHNKKVIIPGPKLKRKNSTVLEDIPELEESSPRCISPLSKFATVHVEDVDDTTPLFDRPSATEELPPFFATF